MRKSICVNARFLTQPLSGVQRYAYNLVKRLPPIRLIAPGTPAPPYADLSLDYVHIRPNRLQSHLWEQLVLPASITDSNVLWSPTNIGPFRARYHVLSIHDVAVFDHPEWYSRAYGFWRRLVLPLVARRACKILTGSNFSKARIIDVLKIRPERIEVTYYGVDPSFAARPAAQDSSTLSKLGIIWPYILNVGLISSRKNVARLLAAWEIVAAQHPRLHLVMVGRSGLAFSDLRMLQSLPGNTIHLEHVDDALLTTLYANALAFAFPSLYEGFGFPVLEAMASGVPVITSNTSSLPEVAGDAAIFVDPYSVESIAEGILRLTDTPVLREELCHKGHAQAKHFTWEHTAERTWKILQEVASAD